MCILLFETLSLCTRVGAVPSARKVIVEIIYGYRVEAWLDSVLRWPTMGKSLHFPQEGPSLSGPQEGTLVRFGLNLANWSERWFPDPLVFAFIGMLVVFITGLLLRESPSKLAIAGGKSFWSLVPFTMRELRRGTVQLLERQQ